MKKFWLGFMVGGMIFGAAAAYAATRITLQNGAGTEVGTSANPVVVQIN